MTQNETDNREWITLTTDELRSVKDRFHLSGVNIPVAFRTIEAMLREKNFKQQKDNNEKF